MTSFRGFSVLLVTTVTLASSALEASRFGAIEARLVLGLAAIYALTVWLREKVYKPETTFFDADHVQSEKEELLVFGHGIEDLTHESRERKVLMGLANDGGERMKIYAIWVLSIVLAVLLHTRIRSFTLIDGVVPVAILSAICFSPFLSQLLLPLAVSLALALIAIVKSDTMLVTFYFVLFAISFFLTLFLYREVTPDRLNKERKTELIIVLKTTFAVTILFLGLYLAMDLIVPEENPFKSNPVAKVRKPSKFSTEKLSRDIAEQVLKYQDKGSREISEVQQGDTPGEPSAGDPSGSSPKDGAPGKNGERSARGHGDANIREGTGNANPREGDGQANVRDGTGKPRDSGQGNQREGNGQANDRDRTGSPRDGGHGNQREGDGQANVRDETGSPRESTGDSQSRDSGESDKSGSGRGVGKNVGESNGTGKGGEKSAEPSDKPSEGNADARTDGKAKTTTGEKPTAKETPAAREKKVEELKKKFEMPIEIGKGLLFLLAAAIGLPILFNLIARWKERPKDEVKLQQLSPRQKKKLQSILHQIKARNLAPDAEVIETYNALLSVFEMGHHPRDEWLPAEDFSMKIAGTIPSLSAPFSAVTNRFSRTLYGRKPVAPEDLNVFRKEVGRILHFFQVTSTGAFE